MVHFLTGTPVHFYISIYNMSYDYFLDTKSLMFDGDFVIVTVYSKFNDIVEAIALSLCDDLIRDGIEPPTYLRERITTFTTFEFSLSSNAYREIYKVKLDSFGKEKESINHIDSYKNEPYRDSSSSEVIGRIHKYVKEYIKYNPDKFAKKTTTLRR